MRLVLVTSPLPTWVGLALAACLAVACATDIRARRIPNGLVLITALLGLTLQMVQHRWVGVTEAGGGLATGLAVWLPFWMAGMMGGGDVKLFAAGAAWLGAMRAVEAALLAGLAGGLVALGWLLWTRGVTGVALRLGLGLHQPLTLRESALSPRDRKVPYALAMSAGLLLEVWAPGLLLGGGV